MKMLLLLPYLFFSARRLLTYLHFFQQEEYDNARFFRWFTTLKVLDRKASIALVLVSVIRITGDISVLVVSILVAAIFLIIGLMEKDPRFVAKKKLAITSRAKRIFFTALTLMAVAGTIVIVLAPHPLSWVAAVQITPVALLVANVVLKPYESRLQSRLWNEAHSRLIRNKPLIIGITGSYGKTSVKHILGHILETQAPTLMTPGSVNTPMGVTRIVREQLRPDHRFFICEMGAYGPGSIERLCRLAPPDIGIITAIGRAHYERFRHLDAVAQTKFELAEAVASNSGKLILAQQVTDFKIAMDFLSKHMDDSVIVGDGETASLRIICHHSTPKGVQLKIIWKGICYLLRAPLYGSSHCINIALAFATACELGVAAEDAVVALESTPQITHRLEVKVRANGTVLIDDAYNSNPVGFADALQLFDVLRENSGRRILVTPGMVELGVSHNEEHRRIGELAANYVDILLPVVPERIKDLTSSYHAQNPNGIIIPCSSYAAADEWLRTNSQVGDIILLENDLPDLYESRPKL